MVLVPDFNRLTSAYSDLGADTGHTDIGRAQHLHTVLLPLTQRRGGFADGVFS